MNQIKQHPYFRGINWDTISNEEVKFHLPPSQPNSTDTKTLQGNRAQFYGREDPSNKATYIEMSKIHRFSPKRGPNRSWSFKDSISREVIDEESDEDQSGEGLFLHSYVDDPLVGGVIDGDNKGASEDDIQGLFLNNDIV